ncbi:MAG: FxsA family protein [Paracoccus sp. (in: a-proteobacteria)]|nr:FxsA family protein [Paracoccus sp. (in: a-proteobacteria)]
MWLVLVLILWPLVEIGLFVAIGSQIGALATVLFVIASAIAGVLVMRLQAALAVTRMRATMLELGDPTRPVSLGASGMVSGILLFIPGFLSSALGLLLLIPPVRDLMLGGLRRIAGAAIQRRREAAYAQGGRPGRDPMIVDGEYSVAPDDSDASPRVEYRERDPRRPPSGWSKD